MVLRQGINLCVQSCFCSCQCNSFPKCLLFTEMGRAGSEQEKFQEMQGFFTCMTLKRALLSAHERKTVK